MLYNLCQGRKFIELKNFLGATVITGDLEFFSLTLITLGTTKTLDVT